jgi:hypothetical protein
MDIALARLVLSIVFGIVIGLLMAWIFRKNENQRVEQLTSDGVFDQNVKVKPAVWSLFLLLFSVLIVGTLQVKPLTTVFVSLDLSSPWITALAARLEPLGLTLQGTLLILMLIVIGITAWKGFETIFEGWSKWTISAIVLIAVTILLAALKEDIGSMSIDITGRFIGVFILLIAILLLVRRYFEQDELSGWIWETWKFVKQIFPLLIIGVFLAGMIRVIIPESWVRTIAGQNTLLANFVGVIFGVFMYFPTLVEVPIAKMFLDLGMARGPLLAYLLADPELSLQSIMVLNGIMGKQKTAVYVSLVAIFSTLAGYLFGLVMVSLG